MAIPRQHIHKVAFRGAMTGSNPTDRSKLGTKRHILTDAEGIPLSAVISSASTHDVKLVTDVVDNAVVKRRSSFLLKQKMEEEKIATALCRDKAYNSEPEEQELIKRGYVLHIPQKRRKGEKEEENVEKDYNTAYLNQKTFCKKMGCGENKLMAQQVQETVHTI